MPSFEPSFKGTVRDVDNAAGTCVIVDDADGKRWPATDKVFSPSTIMVDGQRVIAMRTYINPNRDVGVIKALATDDVRCTQPARKPFLPGEDN